MKAQMSIGREYDCKYDWGCFCQAGEHGVVFYSNGNYSTAFFEAFPEKPKCFLRGEGKTVEEAEEKCWQKYQKVITCNHEMERRHRTDGYAYCKHCDYSAMVFEPLTKCCKCGVPTAYAEDMRGKYFCKKCSHTIPRKYMDDLDPNKKAKRRLPRKLKKMVKQGASIRLYQTHRYEKITFKYYFDLELSGNGKCVSSLFPKCIIRRCIEELKKNKKNQP